MSLTNLDIGACSLTLDGVDLGHTVGGVEVTLSRETAELLADQYAGPVNYASTKQEITVTVNLGEVDLAKLKKVFPLNEAGATATAIPFGTEAGILYRQYAGKLVLHPYNRNASDKTADLVVVNAVAQADLSYSYSKEDQKVYAVEFKGLIDNAGVLAYMGTSPTV